MEGERTEREACAALVEFVCDPAQGEGSFDPAHVQNVCSEAFNDHPARTSISDRHCAFGKALAAAIRSRAALKETKGGP